jgi:hypothetical protein
MTIIGSKVTGSTGLGSTGDFGFGGDTSAGGSTTVTIPSDLMVAQCEDDDRGGGDDANSHFRVSLVWSNTSELSYTLADYCGLSEAFGSTGTTYGTGDFSAEGNNYHVEHTGTNAAGAFWTSTYNSLATITQKAAPTTGTVSLSNASSSSITNIQARWVAYNADFFTQETKTTYSTTGTNVTTSVTQFTNGAFTDSYVTIKPQVYGGSAGNSQFFELGVSADAPGNPASDTATAVLTSGGYYRLEILVTRSDSTTQTLIFNKPYVSSSNPRLHARSEDSETD